jgi:SOS-response transcriptional repressor LexA
MHLTQQRILDLLANNEKFGTLSLRKIAEQIGAEGKPQTAKYHLQKLEEAGFIQSAEGVYKLVKKGYNSASKGPIFSVPIVGSANCGPATIFADQNIQGYLKVSSSLLPRTKNKLFGIIADGMSMNACSVNNKSIESGDYVLVDSEYNSYKDGDIVVAIIDGMATIKEYTNDSKNKRIILRSLSTEKYLPIYLHQGDDFILNGKVVDIIKS